MSSLGLVFSIAKDALSAQRYGMDVTAHNIANVNTEGYSRQRAVLSAKQPAPYGAVLLGRGVDTTEIVRISDQFIENRLAQQNSSMFSFKEAESCMQVLEGVFSEDSEMSLSALLADFWNMWHEVANNPSGTSERRVGLYEHSARLSERFNALYTDLTQLETDLTNAVSAAIGEINQITAEIAQINGEIVGLETGKIANDLRDQRNTLVSQLCEYLDAKTFEQPNGSLTVITARGCVLVDGNYSYDLTLGGNDGKRVAWQGSGGNSVDITDYLNNGKLGGWLDMRDEVIAKYKLDLDALAKELVWAVNRQHSQGLGLKLFQPSTSLTGTYATTTDLGGLPYGEDTATGGYVDYNGTFDLWIGDALGENLNSVTIDLTYTNLPAVTAITDSSTLADLAASINDQIAAAGLTGVTASVSGNAIALTADATHTFGFSDDTSGILGALGINTFFTGSNAGNMGVNDVIGSDKDYIASAQIDSSGNYAVGDNSNALAICDLQYTSIDIVEWTCDRRNGNTQTTVNATIEDYYHAIVGTMGIKSASISRERAFNEAMFGQLGEIRDSISAVSLDEEMTNLIKFQHAYTAAARLISVADEMLNTLLSVK